MSPEVIARFITSDRGRLFTRVLDTYGRSPGQVLAPDDDVQAFDIDAAFYTAELMRRKHEPEPQQTAGMRVVTDLEDQMRAMAGG